MRVWIDAEPVSRAPRLFGFTTLERSLQRVSGAVTEVVVSGATGMPGDPRCRVLDDRGPLGERLAAYLAGVDGPVLVLDGGAVIDHRLLPLLIKRPEPACFRAADTAVLRLSPAVLPPAGARSLAATGWTVWRLPMR